MMAALNKFGEITLDVLLHGLIETQNFSGIVLNNMVLDSRQVKSGDVFIALPGLTVDGRKFVDKAIDAGASAVIWDCDEEIVPIPINWRETDSGDRVPVIGIQNLSQQVGLLADRFYNEPSKNLFMVGITGTNGKTSCSHFIAQALDIKEHCGVIGTTGWGFIDELNTSTHTTPDVVTCHSWLAKMRAQDAKAVAMEVSSHALDQGRIENIEFDCAVFTNLSHEHLDYHGSIENYAAAKTKLFEYAGLKYAVINKDDELGKELIKTCKSSGETLSYALDVSADIFATDIKQTPNGMSFTLHTPYGFSKVGTRLLGRFNIYNLLATAGVLMTKGYDVDYIHHAIESLQPVPGRMQVIREAGKPTVVVDYAHTPDALEQSLSTIKEHFNSETWCVFGCGGDRDKDKRPVMAGIAEKLAEHVVVTSDNPRTEPPQVIIDEVKAGFEKADHVCEEIDRRKAIEYSITQAKAEDVVLIAGKGHETYQQIGNQKFDFSDVLVAKDVLSDI